MQSLIPHLIVSLDVSGIEYERLLRGLDHTYVSYFVDEEAVPRSATSTALPVHCVLTQALSSLQGSEHREQ